MDFSEKLSALSDKVKNQVDSVTTEEAAKNAFIMPFISNVLGYDVFDPKEVVPEFTADVGVKKGEKIDYAIFHEGDVQILVECKKSNGPLTLEHASQLFRYFAATHARIAILTNGVIYHFYTDLDAPNRMDAKPFLVLDLLDTDETLIPELAKLSKEFFNLDSVVSAAEELKYLGQIKRLFAAQFTNPADDWIRFFTTQVYDGPFTKKVKEQFTPLVLKAAGQYMNERVNDRLKTALESGTSSPENKTDIDQDNGESTDEDDGSGIVTTEEELAGFQVIKAIVCSEVPLERITYRDSKTYFAVLLDDNNRKTIARLHFNSKRRKHLGTLDSNKAETRHPIETIADIYSHADTLRNTVKNYLDLFAFLAFIHRAREGLQMTASSPQFIQESHAR
ncbi:type I restriction endonuclease [Salininema proteolyticum]|uniref:Type I restriction endonuclease n=1 Tax=Salininema proteolyticum TaxID=1607685 RepID=A0ABV8TXS6_9ACTN